MRREYNNMCRQRCEDCDSYAEVDELHDTGKGYCTEYDGVVNADDGEFCEDFDQQ